MTEGEPQVSAAAGRFDPEPWRRELLAFVRRMGAGSEAEDLVQETFVRALSRPPRSHPRAWLYRVALNLLVDCRREQVRFARAVAGRAGAGRGSASADPAQVAEASGLAARAWAVVETLPERQRAALLLRIQRHMDYDEVAVALDCSVATARQHFHLGVKAVRNALSEDENV